MIPSTLYLTHFRKRLRDQRLLKYLQVENPSLSVEFYDDARCIEFFEDHCKKEVLETFYKLEHGAHKGDLFRYCILYEYGGYYLDTDDLPQNSLISIVKDYDFVSLLRQSAAGVEEYVHNSFIATRPHNPILKALIDHMISNPRPGEYGFYVKYFYQYLLEKLGKSELSPHVEYELDNLTLYFLTTEEQVLVRGWLLDNLWKSPRACSL